MQLSEDELRRPINGHEEVELALLSANLGNVEVEVADRITLEGFPGRRGRGFRGIASRG